MNTLVQSVALAQARLQALCARHGWEFEWMTEAWLP